MIASNLLGQIIEPVQLKTYGRERVYFGLGDYQGARLLVHFPVHFSEIPALFPIVERPVNAAHVEEIKQYIQERIQAGQDWILGSLTVNANSNDIKLEPIASDLYLVRIANGTLLQIADGQHRISAIAQLLKTGYRACLSDEQIPVTLTVDDNLRQADTDFRDMAQTLPLSPALLLRFSPIPRDRMAQNLVEQVSLFNYTDINKTVPATGTKSIYVINYIAGLVGCAISGRSDAQLTEFDTPELIEAAAAKLSDWLNRFFRYCPATAALVAKDKLTVADVAQFKKNSILSLSVGLEVLGHLIYRGMLHPIS